MLKNISAITNQILVNFCKATTKKIFFLQLKKFSCVNFEREQTKKLISL
jgi:hypothetical protein